MKKILLLILFTNILPVKAEYNGHYISFDIITEKDEPIKGHVYLTDLSYQVTSGSYQQYLEDHFDILLQNHFSDGFGDHAYFEELVRYDYINSNQEDSYAYLLLVKQQIPINEITAVRITQMISFTYLVTISSKHEVNDTKWMNQKAVETFQLNGNLCEWYINLHENSVELKEILLDIRALENKIDSNISLHKQEQEYSDGYHYEEAQKKIDSLYEQKDKLFPSILEQLNETKTVVVQFCSC
ncbi:hypothetical protein ACJD0Z_16470 [Flavobacteriaceae bacterium M23B6Z8]